MTITEFLEARITEDETVARAGFSNQADPEHGWGQDGRAVTPHVGTIHEDVQRDHIVRWHPGRVLRECAAKRAIIAVCEYELTGNNGPSSAVTAELTMQALASVYSDHPDYDPAWAAE